LRIAPRKVRLLADLIKGLSVNEAEAELLLSPKRSSLPLIKLLRSGISAARDKNKSLNSDTLIIKNITVDGGPMLKRYLPRARGSASPIQKKSSHITLTLIENENKDAQARFNIIFKKKEKLDKKSEEKEAKKKVVAKDKDSEKSESMEVKKDKGFFKRVFRRKSV